MGLLDKINSPEDVRNLSESELPILCDELREFIIDKISKNGGHLASNLGAVELTVVLHRMFDTSKDRILFDVGHQSYIHKILTGRKAGFDDLRHLDGMSGFPRMEESVHDAFTAGHASAAISAALGMARARTFLGEDYNVVAVVGDGALTGGLSYEGMCDAGASGERMIVILNDNGMSITSNVGGMARYLSRERMKPGYIAFKGHYRKFMEAIPGGKYIYRFIHRIKQSVKEAVLHCSMFEDMGFTYFGPVDGHNISRMCEALALAKETKGPVLVHVRTCKGKGYPYAELNPDAYHGVNSFDPDTGFIAPQEESFSSVFGRELVHLAEKNNKIMAITAAMAPGTGLTGFAERFPDRFFDVGIAEGHAVTMAAGAAEKGVIPVFAVYSTFLQRSYDMLLHDVAIGKEHVVLAVDRAGLVGEDGETHQGIFDVAYLSSVPGMVILSPASFAELKDMLDFAVNSVKGPVAVRYPRGGEGVYREGGIKSSRVLRVGDDFTIVTYGMSVNTALEAADILEKNSITVDVIKLDFIKPIDMKAISESIEKTGRLLVLEETAADGCIGEKIASNLVSMGNSPRRLILKNLGDRFIPHGNVEELRKRYGIDAESVAETIYGTLPRKKQESYGKDET